MGLQTKRAMKEFQEGRYLELCKILNNLAGYEIAIDFNSESLIDDSVEPEYHAGNIEKVFFTPLLQVFEEITSDDLGKEGLKEILSKIVMKNDSGIYNGNYCYSLDNGVLTIDHDAHANVESIDERREALSELLMGSM
ncbi:hypothetical protein LAT59_03255 [Candidatus Gracilibacteria bacterium]|nr:hypothetical protein [Candidatus Gracilibacteria bacterium]